MKQKLLRTVSLFLSLIVLTQTVYADNPNIDGGGGNMGGGDKRDKKHNTHVKPLVMRVCGVVKVVIIGYTHSIYIVTWKSLCAIICQNATLEHNKKYKAVEL
jgi:hypothetical protein